MCIKKAARFESGQRMLAIGSVAAIFFFHLHHQNQIGSKVFHREIPTKFKE